MIDGINLDKPGTAADYGTAIHAAHEHFILNGVIDKKIFLRKLHELWTVHTKIDPESFNVDKFKELALDGKRCLEELPKFYEANFKGWQPVCAEFPLFEKIDSQQHAFKGYIDAIISVPSGDRRVNVIVDLKTTDKGWDDEKKCNPIVRSQLVYYRDFWTKKLNISKDETRCGFLLLKRNPADGQTCEFLEVPVTEAVSSRSIKVLNNMLNSMKKGIFIKNKSECKYCPYKETEHCT